MTDPRLPDHRPMSPERHEARRRHLVAELRRAETPRRRSRRVFLLAPVAALLLGGGAVAGGLLDGEIESPGSVTCVEEPRLGAESVNVDALFDERDPGSTPAELCAPYWEREALGEGGDVPQLAACIAKGEVYVFPGAPGVCARVGMAPVRERDFRTAAQRRAAFDTAFGDLPISDCPEPDEVRARLERILSDSAMTGWTIELAPGSECVAGVEGSHDRRTLRMYGPDDDSEPLEGEDGFAIEGAAATNVVTDPAKVRRIQRRMRRQSLRRNCDGQAGQPEELVTEGVECLQARAGAGCVPIAVAREVATTLTDRVLGPRWRVVVEGPQGEGACYAGGGYDVELREISLVSWRG